MSFDYSTHHYHVVDYKYDKSADCVTFYLLWVNEDRHKNLVTHRNRYIVRQTTDIEEFTRWAVALDTADTDYIHQLHDLATRRDVKKLRRDALDYIHDMLEGANDAIGDEEICMDAGIEKTLDTDEETLSIRLTNMDSSECVDLNVEITNVCADELRLFDTFGVKVTQR